MSRIRFIAIILLLSGNGFLQIHSQNLILNPSFELYDSCTNFVGNINVVNQWVNANGGSPDYLNICNSGDVSMPYNIGGYQLPQEGNAYAGIGIINQINGREAIQGILYQPLEVGKNYCFEMYISIADTMYYSIDEIGIYFSNDSILASDYTYNNNSLAYQVHLDVSSVQDTSDWHLITGNYIAHGGERFFVISYFSQSLTWNKFRSSALDELVTYYYLDNLNLYECPPPPAIPPIIPNVFSPDGDGINDIFFVKNLPEGCIVKVYNRWGNIVYESMDYQNDWNGTNTTGETISDGTYFYILQTPGGKTYTGTLNSFTGP